MKAGILAALITLLSWVQALSAEYTFTTIAVPGAVSTMPRGINDLGDIVGGFRETTFAQEKPFLFTDGGFVDISVSGASRTTPFAINRSGIITGSFINAGQWAYIMDETQTTVLEAPRADGISDRGVVVGYRAVGAFNQLAYVYKGGQYTHPVTDAEIPGILGSAATGVNDKGVVVGYYFTDAGDPCCVNMFGFVKNGRKLTTVDFIPLGINGNGTIIGLDSVSFDSVIMENGAVSPLAVPEADDTQVRGINDAGQIVGWYQKGGALFGFVGSKVVTAKARGRR